MIKKASESDVRTGYKFLIYGAPGTGKTTLAHSAPKPILFDFDNGRLGVNPAFLNDYVSVENVMSEDKTKIVTYGYDVAKADLCEACASNDYKTIIIDTVSRLRDYQTDTILRDNPTFGKVGKDRQLTGELTLNGYGALKQEFSKFLKKCTTSGKHVICIAHEQANTVKKNGNEITSYTPKISQGALAELTAEFDFIGYMYNYNNDLMISFSPTDTYYAKNRCGMQRPMQLPKVIDAAQNVIARNDFMSRFIAGIDNYYTQQRDIRRQFDELMRQVDTAIASVQNADDANNILANMAQVTPIWDSHITAKELLDIKARSINVVYDNNTNKYVPAQTA